MQQPDASKIEAPKTDSWRAWLDCPCGELPFGIWLQRDMDKWSAFIINGKERAAVPHVEWTGAELVLDITDYDSTIRAKPSEIAGRWSAKFASDEEPAVGVFEVALNGVVYGTFLTTTGDYRFLEGAFDGEELKLSAFDGAHAFLFKARMQPDGTLAGDFWARDAFHDTWTAKKDPKAELPDAFSITKRTDNYDLAKLSFPDLEGKPHTLADPAFAGKARIIEVFGSWCPNCHDASNYLNDLYHRLHSKGLSVVGLAFEITGDLSRDTEQVKKFTSVHKVEYPVLIAGVSDREKASASLPMLEKLRAYPTIIVLDESGKVRAIYTGFSGPATGDEYKKFQIKFEGVVEELLKKS
ncbi:MAG: TlpA family protein disulfide reductase [Planctomycetes bacterium]|nr:TlpA family protein disulfide reductase [Planctomycetota bacterium]